MSVNFGLKATKIIGQRKAFYRQRIPESSCVRKETVVRDILVISRNGDRNIYIQPHSQAIKQWEEGKPPMLFLKIILKSS